MDFLLGYVAGNSKHPFNSIPILQHPELLEELKKLVTIETVGSITKTSGVLYRVKQDIRVRKSFKRIDDGISKLNESYVKLPSMIKKTIDSVARDAGQVTVSL